MKYLGQKRTNIFFLMLVILPLTSIIHINSYSQGLMGDKRDYYSYADRYYFQVNDLYTYNDSAVYLITFRILYDALTFIKSVNSRSDIYIAYPELEVELKDIDGIIRQRTAWRDTVIVYDFEKTNSKKDFITGYILMKVPDNKYRLNYKLQRQKNGRIISNSFELDSIIKRDSVYGIGNPMFVQFQDRSNSFSTNVYDLVILNGDLNFNLQKVYALLPIPLNKLKDKNFEFVCNSILTNTSETNWNVKFRTNCPAEIIKATDIVISKNNSIGNINVAIVQSDSQFDYINQKFAFLKTLIPVEYMYPGDYELLIISGKDTIRKIFKIVWEDMPLSLRKSDYSVKSMYYILTDEEYDEMNSGTASEKFQKLLDYWKKQDPSQGTAYNEAMAEYFRRVDFAYFNFKTISQKDGSLTDRGKIYILFGEPTSKERILKGKTTQEVWKYDKLKKEFIFEIVSAGNYKLVKFNE